jgi:exonuclease SbcD
MDFSFRTLTPLHEIQELQASFAELLDPAFYTTISDNEYFKGEPL